MPWDFTGIKLAAVELQKVSPSTEIPLQADESVTKWHETFTNCGAQVSEKLQKDSPDNAEVYYTKSHKQLQSLAWTYIFRASQNHTFRAYDLLQQIGIEYRTLKTNTTNHCGSPNKCN